MRIIVMGHQQLKMLKRQAMAEHRKTHLENAKLIREQAELFLDKMSGMLTHVKEEMSEAEYNHAKEQISNDYNNMLAEAIAEENSKCMDRTH